MEQDTSMLMYAEALTELRTLRDMRDAVRQELKVFQGLLMGVLANRSPEISLLVKILTQIKGIVEESDQSRIQSSPSLTCVNLTPPPSCGKSKRTRLCDESSSGPIERKRIRLEFPPSPQSSPPTYLFPPYYPIPSMSGRSMYSFEPAAAAAAAVRTRGDPDLSYHQQPPQNTIQFSSPLDPIPLSLDTNGEEGLIKFDGDRGPRSSLSDAVQSGGGPGRSGVFWSGSLDWNELKKAPEDGRIILKITRHTTCQMSSNSFGPASPAGLGWPPKLFMQLIPKAILLPLGHRCFQGVKAMYLHFGEGKATESLTKLMSSGFAGCVHFSHNSPKTEGSWSSNNNVPKIFLLVYSQQIQTFIGFIPRDQDDFIHRFKLAMGQAKRLLSDESRTDGSSSSSSRGQSVDSSAASEDLKISRMIHYS